MALNDLCAAELQLAVGGERFPWAICNGPDGPEVLRVHYDDMIGRKRYPPTQIE